MNERVLFAWSGGKDSAVALYEIQMGVSSVVLEISF